MCVDEKTVLLTLTVSFNSDGCWWRPPPALSLLGCGLLDPHFYHGNATIRVTTYDVITVVMGRDVGRLTRTLRTVVMVRGQCGGGWRLPQLSRGRKRCWQRWVKCMKATIISDKVVVHIAFCLSAGKYKCLLVPELTKSFSCCRCGVRELGALGDPEGSGVWDAACRARCCDTPAPSPASRGGAPGRMSGVWSAGWQRAGRGDAILRLQVQHPIMELQGECEGRQQHTTGQDYRWGRDDMITKRRPLTVPFLKPGRTLKTASLMTCNQHPLLRAGDSRRQSHMYTWTEDMRIERQGIGARARKPSGGRWVPGIEVLNVLIFKQKKRSHIAHIFTM